MSLWIHKKSEKQKHSPHRRTLLKNIKNQEASFCIRQKGSYTIEAAIVIPLVSAYLVTLLYFFTVLQIQCTVDEALIYAGRKTAVESSVVESEEVLFVSAEGYLLYALKNEPLIKRYVKHGALGINLWKSEFDGEEIILRAEYEIKLPITLFGIKQMEASSENCFRKWLGNHPVQNDENMVYVTPSGEVFHKNLDCRSINLSIHMGKVSEIEMLRGENGQKFYECLRCAWEDEKKERIYYTDYGTLYHKDIMCSSLKRTIVKIKRDEIGDRRPCSYCYGL